MRPENRFPAPGRRSIVKFSLSTTSSPSSSRESSPVRSVVNPSLPNGSVFFEAEKEGFLDGNPGLRPMDVYDTTMSWWRAAVRRKLVGMVQTESVAIARMQSIIRSSWLDTYFVYTSTLGTHTFFMILLPAFLFFGYEEVGLGLLVVLALGVNFASVIKDLFCSPRPFAPPVTRLTIGSHHLEYGFPSTHTTNCVSIALFFLAYFHRLSTTPSDVLDPTSSPIISSDLFLVLCVALSIYTFSIVFGRLYTAMHSFTDCVAGVFLGTVIWWGHSSWAGIPVTFTRFHPLSLIGFGTRLANGSTIIRVGRGLGLGQWVEGWVQRGGWEVPLIIIPICLLLVNQHPQPVDNCPCFEDAIAFGSVVLGALVGRWAMEFYGLNAILSKGKLMMPGSGWVRGAGDVWVQVERSWRDVGIWWTFASVKLVFGIITIFAWRIFAKTILHFILPPTFRFLSRSFRLPHRRFYTPATEYTSVPSDFNGKDGFELHPIPSVIDLPSAGGLAFEVGGIGSSGVGIGYPASANEIKLRSAVSCNNKSTDADVKGQASHLRFYDGCSPSSSSHIVDEEKEISKFGETKHYDADVLTKVIVYAGIAVLATEVLPITFELLGWGVKSSP